MSLLAGMLLAQMLVTKAGDMPFEQKIDRLGEVVASGSNGLMRSAFADPQIVEQLERVGFEQGCPVVNKAVSAQSRAYRPQLTPFARDAVTQIVPRQRLDEVQYLNFQFAPLTPYQGRVSVRFRELAKGPLDNALSDIRAAVVAEAQAMPDLPEGTNGAPTLPDVIIEGFGVKEPIGFDNPDVLLVACFNLTTPDKDKPVISHNGKTYPDRKQAE